MQLPQSRDLTNLATLPTPKIWLPAWYAACKILAVTRRHFQWSHLSSEIAYERDIATCEILLPARHCFRHDMATCEIWLLARYGYLSDMRPCKILAITGYLFPVNLPLRRYYQPVRYDCQRDMAATDMWLPTSYDYQHGMLACKILAVTRRHFQWCPLSSDIAYEPDMATCEICVPAKY